MPCTQPHGTCWVRNLPSSPGGNLKLALCTEGRARAKERGPSRGLGGRVKTPRDLPARLVPGCRIDKQISAPSTRIFTARGGPTGGSVSSTSGGSAQDLTLSRLGPWKWPAVRESLCSPRLPRRSRPLEGFLQRNHPELRRYPIKLVEMRS